MGDLDKVTSGSQRPVVALVPRVLSASGATQGATGVGVVGAGPKLGDDAGSSLRDLVIRGADAGVPGNAIPGDTTLVPGSSGAIGLGVFRLYLLSSPGFLPLPINWRRVGDKAESTCLRVATTKRLLHKTLVSVDQNILHIIREV
jgi:hypothetical protein